MSVPIRWRHTLPTSSTAACSSSAMRFSTNTCLANAAGSRRKRRCRCSGSVGRAANTAANIVSLGGHATLISLVGTDEGGQTLQQCAADAGVELKAVDHGLATLRKTRIVGQHQQIVRLDYEDIQSPSPSVEAEILRQFEAAVGSCDIVVISDYAKGFLSATIAQTIIRRAHEVGLDVVVDPRPQNRACYTGCDNLTPNWKEYRALLGLPDAEATPEEIGLVANSLAKNLGAHVVLTLGAQGILFHSR